MGALEQICSRRTNGVALYLIGKFADLGFLRTPISEKSRKIPMNVEWTEQKP
jgi:hypothetical protein